MTNVKRALQNLVVWLLLAAPAAALGQYTYTNADGSIYTYATNADGSASITGYSGPPWAVIIPTNLNNLLVTGIGDSAFAENLGAPYYLTSVTIPDSITSIGGSAFINCESLTNITIPESVTNLGNYAFELCYSFRNITIPAGIPNIGEFEFYSCTNLTNVTIANGATAIEEYAFNACTGLVSISIPDSVTTLGDGVFFGCGSLANVTIGKGLTNIGILTFHLCTALTNITFPNSLIAIEDYAFAQSGLTSVTLPRNVSYLGEAPFSCNDLATITVDAQNASYSSSNGVLFDKNQSTLIEFPSGMGGNYTVPASVTSIGGGAFIFCASLTGVFFEGNAPGLGDSVFVGSDLTVYYLAGTTGWSDFSAGTGVPVVLWNPLIQADNASFGVRNSQFGFTITGTTNIPIVVEACTNLANPVWTPLTDVTLTNGSFSFSEAVQVNGSGRYYRISSP
jgi:hypothetical protein